ncbi:MAG: TlpA disulfide reductase family protein [Fuerstiella sp.]
MRRIQTLLAVMVLFAGAGDRLSADEPSEKPEVTVTLLDGTWADARRYIAEQKGKVVVVVDFWSTSCLPCMTEFPNLVKLKDKYGDKVVRVSFNLDYAGIKSKPPSYYRPRVEKFLTLRKADFRNYLCTVDALDFFDEMDLNSIPAVFVYGRDGSLAKRFDDSLLEPGEEEAFTYEADIFPFLDKLVK